MTADKTELNIWLSNRHLVQNWYLQNWQEKIIACRIY